jgi:hypothetical protein
VGIRIERGLKLDVGKGFKLDWRAIKAGMLEQNRRGVTNAWKCVSETTGEARKEEIITAVTRTREGLLNKP